MRDETSHERNSHTQVYDYQTEKKIGPILASTNCQFRKPLFYPGQVTVCSKVDSINKEFNDATNAI